MLTGKFKDDSQKIKKIAVLFPGKKASEYGTTQKEINHNIHEALIQIN